MLDYSKITEEEIAKRTAAMPAGLRAIYESDSFGFDLLKLANDKFFDEDEANTLQMFVGLYLMGFMTTVELSEEIAKELYVEPVESDEMVAKIKSLIATATPTPISKPVFAASNTIPTPAAPSTPAPTVSVAAQKPTLSTPSTPPSQPSSRPTPNNPTIQTASPATPVSPTFQTASISNSKGPAPFMIHTHEEPKAVSETKTFTQPQSEFSRPAFRDSGRTNFAETPKIRVDFNGRIPEQPKIVNYVAGQVSTPIKTTSKPINPVTSQTIPTSRTSGLPSVSPDIHPENIIDLKDLPK